MTFWATDDWNPPSSLFENMRRCITIKGHDDISQRWTIVFQFENSVSLCNNRFFKLWFGSKILTAFSLKAWHYSGYECITSCQNKHNLHHHKLKVHVQSRLITFSFYFSHIVVIQHAHDLLHIKITVNVYYIGSATVANYISGKGNSVCLFFYKLLFLRFGGVFIIIFFLKRKKKNIVNITSITVIVMIVVS